MNVLYEWYTVAEQLKELKARESELRQQVFDEYFPEPEEGTNRVEVPGGELVATYPFNYSVEQDEEVIAEALEHVPASKRDKLINWKASLSKKVYKSLSKKAMTAFTAACVTVKPGTPSLKIVPAEADD